MNVESDVSCGSDGGSSCVLNYEHQRLHYVTVIAYDNGTPPLSKTFDNIHVALTNVNDRPSDVVLDPNGVLEGKQQGKS